MLISINHPFKKKATYSAGDTYRHSSESHGGARPKNTHYYDNYRNPAFDYGYSYYNSHRSINQNVVPNNIGRNQDISRKPESPRPASESRYNGHQNLRRNDYHSTQQYNGYLVNPQYNQTLNSAPSTANQMYQKNLMNLVNHVYV